VCGAGATSTGVFALVLMVVEDFGDGPESCSVILGEN